MAQTRGFRTANRRYRYLFWPMIAAYAAIIIGARVLVDEASAPTWLNAACALATTLPLIGVLYALRRKSEETDEYTRMKLLRSMRDAGFISAGVAFLVGFLQIFGVIAYVDVFWFGPLFLLAIGLSRLTNRSGRTI